MRLIFGTVFVATVLLGQPQQIGRDPIKDLEKRAEKEAIEKNYKEMRDAATELAELGKQISVEINEGGQHVISARLFDRLDKIEKLTKRIRDKAKGAL